MRAAFRGLRGFILGGGRLSLTPSVEVGLRRDGGDAETCAGMDVGGGLAFSDTVTELSLDVRVRTLLVHQAEGFTDRGMSLSLGWDPTPVEPAGADGEGRPVVGRFGARRGRGVVGATRWPTAWARSRCTGPCGQLNAEVGYGLPVGARFVGTPRVGLATS